LGRGVGCLEFFDIFFLQIFAPFLSADQRFEFCLKRIELFWPLSRLKNRKYDFFAFFDNFL